MKIAICIPTCGTIKTKTFRSIIKLLKQTKLEWYMITQQSSILHESRNQLVKEAQKLDCTHLLFIDSDMEFEPDALDKLLTWDKDIIGVPYNTKQLPPNTTAKKFAEGFDIWERHGDLTKCAGLGTGFMLIKLSVFDKLTKPYFYYTHDKEGKLDYGEDMYFCRKAREAGYDIWFDQTISIGHIGDYRY